MSSPERYGNVKLETIKRDFDALRDAVRAHAPERAEEALDRFERWVDLFYSLPAALRAAQPAPPVATGDYDRDGRMVYVGDRIRIRLESEHMKKEYWHPEYEVIFEAPHYTLRHIGGGKDSDTARFYWRVPQPSSTQAIETLLDTSTTLPTPADASAMM